MYQGPETLKQIVEEMGSRLKDLENSRIVFEHRSGGTRTDAVAAQMGDLRRWINELTKLIEKAEA